MSGREPAGGGAAVWVAGLVVVVAAGAATAHGLYEVALGSRTPAGIAWLYPVITDGLALVAYAATTRLGGAARRYAWSVVVLAAGLSGLAQATYLAGTVGSAPTALRFGVGAWPAVAAAIAAHLLFLIGTSRTGLDIAEVSSAVQDPERPSVPPAERPALSARIQPRESGEHQTSELDTLPRRSTGLSRALSPRDRALTTAQLHQRQHGALPTVRELESLAQVSRGTAATALQELKAARNGLHVIDEASDEGLNP
jgi:hypothetical protein